jgi:hypothetical protein
MQVRKVVTGHDAKGRAVIARDEQIDGEKKQRGCDWQPVRSEHPAHNNQSTPDRDKSDNDMQNGESADRHP